MKRQGYNPNDMTHTRNVNDTTRTQNASQTATQQMTDDTTNAMQRNNMGATDQLTSTDVDAQTANNCNYLVLDLLEKQVTQGMLLKQGEDGNRQLMSKIWNATYRQEAVDARTVGKYAAFMKVIHLTMDADDRQYLYIKNTSNALSGDPCNNLNPEQLFEFHTKIKKIVDNSFEKRVHSITKKNERER